MRDRLTIKQLTTAGEIFPCNDLQVRAWNMPDEAEVVPVHQLLTAAKYGGLVLGAFEGDRMIGMSYGFVGLYGGRPMHCSHMLAVLPEYRGQGVGVLLKLEQRRLVLAGGLTVMHWTYDPMELVNGNLNIRRLGGTCGTYIRDLYGELNDGMNAGLPSDRLVVEWALDSDRVRQALDLGGAPQPALADCFAYDGSALPDDRSRPLALKLPRHFQELKGRDPEAALRWRLAVRDAFELAFAAGYRLTGAEQDTYILS